MVKVEWSGYGFVKDMNQENIKSIISNSSLIQNVIDSEDFYFEKGRQALNKWMELEIEENQKSLIMAFANDYQSFKEELQRDSEAIVICELLLEIISYCDEKANDKTTYNKYEDNRTLARANVYMQNWVTGVIHFKFGNITEISSSVLNALQYLQKPNASITMLSERHREMISLNLLKIEYQKETFIQSLMAYFFQFNLKVTNPENYTYLVSCIIYETEDIWKDKLIGLMASDGTMWQEKDLDLKKNGYEGVMIWNSKKPTGGANTLKLLRERIAQSGFFYLYYCSKGEVTYKAKILDFVTSPDEYSELLKNLKKRINRLESNFSEYKDEKKKAQIVFYAESMEKVTNITVDQFTFYKSQKPRQDNLSPIKDTTDGIPISNISDMSFQNTKTETSMNQILFGPPGTGKTYNTINQALHICGEDLTGLSRSDIKARFEQKVDEGRIIFTTFHQSMTYEDFVEGIKPIEPEKEGDPVIYRVEDGIFRKLCIEASFSLAKVDESVTTEKVLDFSLAFDNFVQEIEERLASEETIELATKNGGKVVVDGISQKGNIIIKHPGKDNTYPVSKQRLSKLHAAFPDLADVNNIDLQFRSIIGGSNSTANWSVLNAIRNNNPVTKETPTEIRKYSWDDKVQVVKSLKKEDYKGKTGEPYVLIIDEINRGNVSQIFGELITLIEEDKRLGNPEAIQVQLPYSKDWFGVPPNVYIIGTMNTADRSVEALDTALRRRFSFTEMPPKPGLINTEGKTENGIVNGIELSVLLETINKRIEKLLDKDHMIGHSYFLSVEGLKDLKSVLQNKIVPLLQEYFFGDYGKIGLVLGSKFFDITDNQVDEDFFAPFEDYDSSPLVERKVYHLRNIQDMSDELFIKALNDLQRKNK